MTKLARPKHPSEDHILIVGDWVVDEYWFLVRHHSRISSHTGFTHFRVASEPTEIVADLCGAGHVARVLYQLRKKSPSPYALVGIGNWNPADTQLIAHLVHARDHAECGMARASYRLAPMLCSTAPAVNLLPLQGDGATIRVIRQYHYEKFGLEQLGRIDWEPPRESSSSPHKRDALDGLSLPPKSSVSSIVVNDLDKGVVTDGMVAALKSRYPRASWYVRSKKLQPEWLASIGNSLELAVLGPEVAAQLNPWERWLVNGKPSLEAMEAIQPRSEEAEAVHARPGRNVFLLSEQHEVIGKLNDGVDCVTGQSARKPSVLSELGWPTAFFASIFRKMYDSGGQLTVEDVEEALDWADEYAGIPRPKRVAISQEIRSKEVACVSWEEEARKWEEARTGHGIIRQQDQSEVLELWRGASLLPGYIACIQEKRKIVERIGRYLRGFKRESSPAHPLSILFQADPGAGKTFLAEALAREFGFELIRYDITQMVHRVDLLDLFETVATAQASKSSKLLVFVDEINAPLEQGAAYGAFLAPLEQGFYIRYGKKFSLRPCVWMFAGTKLGDEDGKEPKLSDFVSRMTLIERFDYASLKASAASADRANQQAKLNRLNQEAKLEQVYLGLTMIKQEFSDVQEVSYEILEYFGNLEPAGAPARRLRGMARSLRDVQYGRVTRANTTDWGVNWRGGREAQRLIKLRF